MGNAPTNLNPNARFGARLSVASESQQVNNRNCIRIRIFSDEFWLCWTQRPLPVLVPVFLLVTLVRGLLQGWCAHSRTRPCRKTNSLEFEQRLPLTKGLRRASQ